MITLRFPKDSFGIPRISEDSEGPLQTAKNSFGFFWILEEPPGFLIVEEIPKESGGILEIRHGA